MFRATVRTLNLSNRVCSPNNFNISPSDQNVQSVRRWRYRRPLELGTSKSKLFRIPENPQKDVEEFEEMKRLNTMYKLVSNFHKKSSLFTSNHYKSFHSTQLKSLKAYFREEKLKRDEALAQKPQSIADDADFERISKINDEWNRNVAKVREARLKAERIQMQKQIRWELEQQREYEEEERRKINELVLKEKVCI